MPFYFRPLTLCRALSLVALSLPLALLDVAIGGYAAAFGDLAAAVEASTTAVGVPAAAVVARRLLPSACVSLQLVARSLSPRFLPYGFRADSVVAR